MQSPRVRDRRKATRCRNKRAAAGRFDAACYRRTAKSWWQPQAAQVNVRSSCVRRNVWGCIDDKLAGSPQAAHNGSKNGLMRVRAASCFGLRTDDPIEPSYPHTIERIDFDLCDRTCL